MCPVRVIVKRSVNIIAHKSKAETFLSSYYVGTTKYDVTDVDI